MRTSDPLAGIAAFLAVAESLSFSRAAEDLEMARATVSAQVRDLERRLGTRLLQRDTRHVTLTEAGQSYRQALAGLLPQVREAERAAAAFQMEPVGQLRISAPPDLGSEHVMPAVAEYLKINPAVSVELELASEAIDLVERGFDLAIRGTISVEPTVVTRQIGASPLVVCASPEYLARRGTPDHPIDLARHDCLHFSRLRWGPVWHFEPKAAGGNEAALRVPITPRLRCNDGRGLLAAAVEGAGVVLEPMFVVGPSLRAGCLVPLLPDWKITAVPIHAVYPAGKQISLKVRSFVDLLARHLARHPDLQDQ